MEKIFCLKCKEDLSDVKNLKKCKCGSRDFVYGNTVIKTSNWFGCSCGSETMSKVAHINMNPRYISSYQCDGCCETISTETYYESPYY